MCRTDLDLDGQRIEVIRTQVLKSGDMFTLYCSARDNGFKFPEKETEPDIKDPEKEPGKDNPRPTDETADIFIEQIQRGGEVRLTAPVTITDNSNNIELEKDVTLDLNGQTLDLSANLPVGPGGRFVDGKGQRGERRNSKLRLHYL